MSITIGVFDSGVGGLSVLEELYKEIPASYMYIGDSLRAPYGNKSKDELLLHTKSLLKFLQSKKVDIFVSACNSLSTLDVEPLLKELSIQSSSYVTMTDFTQESIQAFHGAKKILIYATKATIESGIYQDLFKESDVTTLVASNLARGIEESHEIEIDEEVDMLVDYVLEHSISHVFLGCTHFPLIQEYLDKRFLDTGITFINPALFLPEVLKRVSGDKKDVNLFFTKKTKTNNDFSLKLFGKEGEEVTI